VGWNVELDVERGWIAAVFAGAVTRADSALATRRALALAASGDATGFLVDVREAFSRLSTGDIYAIPAMWEHGGADRASAVALVIADDPQMRRDAEFFENTCRNRGWNVCVFDALAPAMAWLERQRPAAGNTASA